MYMMYKITFESNPLRGTFIDANKTIVFNLEFKTISVLTGSVEDMEYSMTDIPVTFSKFLIPIWERVLVEAPIQDRQYLFELYNLYSVYVNNCNQMDRLENDKVIPVTNYYFTDEDSNSVKDYMKDIIMNSVYDGKPIGFFIDFQNQKIRVYYDGDKKYYTFESLPKKYYTYMSTCLDDVETYLLKLPYTMISINPNLYACRADEYNKVLDNWLKFKDVIKSYLSL